MDLLPLHPMVVHFPIALLFATVLFDIAGAWFKRDSFRDGALWLLLPVFWEVLPPSLRAIGRRKRLKKPGLSNR